MHSEVFHKKYLHSYTYLQFFFRPPASRMVQKEDVFTSELVKA